MTDHLITPPAALAVSLDLAKTALREELDDTTKDALITIWVGGIIQKAEERCDRAFITQGRRVTLDSFPEAIRLGRLPVSSVDCVKYYNPDGVEQTLDPADYKVDLIQGYVVPARGKSWPSTTDEINSVSVNYTCGYGNDHTSVPDGLKLYMLGKLVEQFDPQARPEKETLQSEFINRLLDPFLVNG